ncbi:MAG: hypothetical protein LRZ88_03995, partial [Candidatus Cloacimonetes bacterium]|nr:hypothetical protein [Candidatus Cloacimonadota bacterium]
MKHEKIIWLVIAFACALYLLPAQNVQDLDFQQLGWQEFPIAGIDNLFVPYSNPSLLGTGNANGIGLVHLADDEQFQKRYWIIVNTDGLSYSYERDHGVEHHMLASGSELLPAHIFPQPVCWIKLPVAGWQVQRWYLPQRCHIPSGKFRFSGHDLGQSHARTAIYRGGIALRPMAFVPSTPDYRPGRY